jgi:hypothetical protein
MAAKLKPMSASGDKATSLFTASFSVSILEMTDPEQSQAGIERAKRSTS